VHFTEELLEIIMATTSYSVAYKINDNSAVFGDPV
jgi:hypothetical protein